MELEGNRRNRLREEMTRVQGEREKLLEGQLAKLREQLEIHKDAESMGEYIEKLKEELVKTKQELSYAYVSSYCIKRQL